MRLGRELLLELRLALRYEYKQLQLDASLPNIEVIRLLFDYTLYIN